MAAATGAAQGAQAQAFEKFLTDHDPGSKRTDAPVFRFTDEAQRLTRDRVIPTGIVGLDYALGVGGIAKGRIVELFGPEGSGKTSLALATCASAQRDGGYVGFVDAEHALSREQMESLGVDPAMAAISQPDHGQQALELAIEMAESGAFSVVVIDSAPALVPKEEVEGTMEDERVGKQASVITKGLRRLGPAANRTGTVVFFINQLRENIGGYGATEITPGGRALKFWSSIRMDIRAWKSEHIKQGDQVVGQTCRVNIVKNKTAPPYRKSKYQLYFGKGIRYGSSLLETCLEHGVITKSASYFYDGRTGETLGQGEQRVADRLDAEPALYDHYRDLLALRADGEQLPDTPPPLDQPDQSS